MAAAFRGGRAPRGRGPRVGQLPQARHTFVDGMVDLEVLSFQVFAALSPVVEPDEEHPEVVLRAFADQERIARQAAGLVNQGRGSPLVNVVEHGLVQRCQDALECVVATHGDVFLQVPVSARALEMLVEGRAHSIGSEWVFPSPGGWVLSSFDFSDLLRELAFEFLVPIALFMTVWCPGSRSVESNCGIPRG